MLKFTFIIITSLLGTISFANTNQELQKRLELYGLLYPREPELISNIKNRRFRSNQINESIKFKLQNEIKTNYLSKIQKILGVCSEGNCLQEQDGHLELNTATSKICMPYTQCEFYKCMEEKYQCAPTGSYYFTDLAFPTCSTYKENIQKKWFTQKGYDWIYTVMVCLQKGLVDECEVKNNCEKETPQKTCEYITDFTLKFHPGCYLNSGVGVCKLPLKDKINIWRTVGKFLTPREREEAIKVVLSCIKQGF